LAIIKRLEKTHHLVVRWCCGWRGYFLNYGDV
jgi:hypothetical protein